MRYDGSAFNADAVKFNFDRMLDENPPTTTGTIPVVLLLGGERRRVIDSSTSFTLNAPYAPFLSNLAYPTGLIVSPAAVKKHGADFGRNASGTGAFTFKEWRSNEAVVVEANGDYWGGAPALDAVVFRPITDANTRVAEMLAGGIDMMVEVPPVSLSRFGADLTWFMSRLVSRLVPDSERKGRPRNACDGATTRSTKRQSSTCSRGTAAVAAGQRLPFVGLQRTGHYNPDKARAACRSRC